MPTPRWRSCAVSPQWESLRMGGYNSGVVNTVEIYDTLTNAWSEGDTESFCARSDFAAEVIDGKIYVIGGQGDTVSPQIFDPASNAWTTPITTGSYSVRQGLSATLINREIYAFGGTSGEYLSSIDVFDPITNTWTNPATSGTSIARAGGCATLYNGKVYIMGGRDDWGLLDTNSVFTLPISSVNPKFSTNGISLFPNPTNGMVTIQTPQSANLSHFTVTNMLGEILVNMIIESGPVNIPLDLSDIRRSL